MAGAVVTLVAIFPPYLGGGVALSSDVRLTWFQVLLSVIAVVAAVLLSRPRTYDFGVAFLAIFVVGAVPLVLRSVIPAFTTGSLPLGALLQFFGFALVAAAAVMLTPAAIEAGHLRVRAGSRTALWVVAGGLLGLLYVTGDVMTWIRLSVQATDQTWLSLHQLSRPSADCCTLTDERGWTLALSVLGLLMAVLVPVAAGVLYDSASAAAALTGLTAALALDPVSSLPQLVSTYSPHNLGYPDTLISQAGLVTSVSGLPGLWITCLAVAGLGLLSFTRAVAGNGVDASG